MSPDDRVYLNDIWERMERIEMYTRSGKAAFFDSLLEWWVSFLNPPYVTTLLLAEFENKERHKQYRV